MSRRFLSLVLLTACVAVLVAPADALVSIHGKGLEDWVANRNFDIRNDTGPVAKKQRTALGKSATKLGKVSADLTGDAKVISKALKPLLKPFVGDAEFDTTAGTLVDAIQADLMSRRTSLQGLPAELSDAKVATFVGKKLVLADKKIAKAQAATDLGKRAKLVWQAFKKLDGLDKKALKSVQARDRSDGFLLITGDNNHATRVLRPTRQVDDENLIPDTVGKSRQQFEDGAQAGAVGNYLLILNWTDTNNSATVDRVRVQMFRLIGLGDAPEAWVRDSFTLGVGSIGITTDQTPGGTRLTFNNTELSPDAGGNSAVGTLFLNGSLLLTIE